MIHRLAGMEIYDNINLVEHVSAERSWRERLFTRPWRPLIRVKTVAVPMKHFLMMDGKLFGHPATIARLRSIVVEGDILKDHAKRVTDSILSQIKEAR